MKSQDIFESIKNELNLCIEENTTNFRFNSGYKFENKFIRINDTSELLDVKTFLSPTVTNILNISFDINKYDDSEYIKEFYSEIIGIIEKFLECEFLDLNIAQSFINNQIIKIDDSVDIDENNLFNLISHEIKSFSKIYSPLLISEKEVVIYTSRSIYNKLFTDTPQQFKLEIDYTKRRWFRTTFGTFIECNFLDEEKIYENYYQHIKCYKNYDFKDILFLITTKRSVACLANINKIDFNDIFSPDKYISIQYTYSKEVLERKKIITGLRWDKNSDINNFSLNHPIGRMIDTLNNKNSTTFLLGVSKNNINNVVVKSQESDFSKFAKTKWRKNWKTIQTKKR
ncbi:hypothetical protein V2P56_02915 [Mycoplasma capricolum subsp. capricolum]|uniref:hypothetical protein n=1 Tax=Mycoplasma capricolum TaxID=2095 RepID=UPI0034DAE418